MSQQAIRRVNTQMGRGLDIRSALTAVGNEVYKGLMHAWGERTQILIELPLFIIFFLLFTALVGQGERIVEGRFAWALDPEVATWLFIGFASFTFFYLHTAKLFWRLLGEIQTGTLEQVYLSPLPAWLIAAAGRVIAAVVETTFVVAAVYLAASLAVDLDIAWRAEAVVPLAFLVVASVGYSLVIGGLTLLWKRIEILNDVLPIPVILFGGVLVPLESLAGWMSTIGRLLPITHSVASLRAVVLEGQSAITMWGDGGLVWLAVSAAGWLLAGVLFFRFGESRAKRQGTLSRY